MNKVNHIGQQSITEKIMLDLSASNNSSGWNGCL